jgi:hypothetical protein
VWAWVQVQERHQQQEQVVHRAECLLLKLIGRRRRVVH